MFDEIYCGRCGEDVSVEKTEYTIDWNNSRMCVIISTLGRCPECGDLIGDKHIFYYHNSDYLSEKEIEKLSKTY